MPIYEYQCADCGERDQRVAGLDDHTALCAAGDGLMLRLDEELFAPYFAQVKEEQALLETFAAGTVYTLITLARAFGADPALLASAQRVADAMANWPVKKIPDAPTAVI